jgi:formate hydrogenlyase subunit 3/multisubunit Na+/H+ antiporter MnhD subunit
MYRVFTLLGFATLWAPLIFVARTTGLLTPLPTVIGLSLQAFVGSVILVYLKGYENSPPRWKTRFGYALCFTGLAGCYLVGRSLWLPIFWEVSSFGALFLYVEHPLDSDEIRSYVALAIVSSLSCILLALWVLLPNEPFGNIALVSALLLKSAFFGTHFWLPEAHGGGPAHASALYSGVMINLPLLLFVKLGSTIAFSDTQLKCLAGFAAVGVCFGGVTAFFKKNLKRALAYSTIENTNFLWLCLFLGKAYPAGGAWMVLFYLALIHHSLSKSFQFLSLGYLCRLAESNLIDRCKGVGRISGVSRLLLSVGTFSFLGAPFTCGFLAEMTFLFLVSQSLTAAPIQSFAWVSGLAIVLLGMIVGSACHLKIFGTVVLSVPDDKFTPTPKKTSINLSLGILASAIVLCPPAVLEILQHFPANPLTNWLSTGALIGSAGVLVIVALVIFAHLSKIRKRVIWDCGNDFVRPELSIPGSVISDPLHSSLARSLLVNEEGSRLDRAFEKGLSSFFERGGRWAAQADSIGSYLSFSILFLAAAAILITLLRSFGGMQ